MLGKFATIKLLSSGRCLIKPCHARNISYFFRSTFSWGERRAKIVLEHRTQWVDRRMAKMINALGSGATQAAIGRTWEKLDVASK